MRIAIMNPRNRSTIMSDRVIGWLKTSAQSEMALVKDAGGGETHRSSQLSASNCVNTNRLKFEVLGGHVSSLRRNLLCLRIQIFSSAVLDSSSVSLRYHSCSTCSFRTIFVVETICSLKACHTPDSCCLPCLRQSQDFQSACLSRPANQRM